MARHKFTKADRIAGARKALRNPKTPARFKKAMRTMLSRMGVRV
jgi:hypothetical protein